MPDERKFQIGSAIFNADHGHLAEAVGSLDAAGIDFFHWDVFDGQFIPDLGFSPQSIRSVRQLTKKPFTIHLAANHPSKFIKPLADSGADLIYIPAESEPLLYEAIIKMKEVGVKAGVSIAVGTSINNILDVLPFIDGVMVLGRVYGETSLDTNFLPSVLIKIADLRSFASINRYSFNIEAAGSLTIETAIAALKAGADSIAFGKTLYKLGNPSKRLAEIRKSLEEGVLC